MPFVLLHILSQDEKYPTIRIVKHIVILGGGFAGIAAIKELIKRRKELSEYKILLIDQHSFHLFTPSLYEVATSEEPQKNVAIPYKEIYPSFVTHEKRIVKIIDVRKKRIEFVNSDVLLYDFLLISLGSESAYFSIPGLKEYSIALKSLADAVRIKNHIKTMCCKEGECKRKVQVIIGGGGFSGTELAAELLTYKDRLAKQHNLSQQCLDISIIQGSDRLLKELDEKVSNIAKKRLDDPQIHLCLNEHITEVTKTHVTTDKGNHYTYHMLIWTGGVKGNSVLEKSNLPVNKRGQIPVDAFLRVSAYDSVFAAGDCAQYIQEGTKEPAPTVAQIAEEEGKIAGINIYRKIKHFPLLQYHMRHFGYVVPLRGHFAVTQFMGNIRLVGFTGWLLQQVVFLRYLLGILPFIKAFKKWNVFEQNLEMS
jgi:NADH dehydrogenase